MMKNLIVVLLIVLAFFSCSPQDTVQLSGRIENGDSIVSLWVNDSIYTFPLDADNFFSGEVVLERACYATVLDNSLNLYLSPGEDLEIYVNALNPSGSLYFRGSLGGINSYLKEQEVAVFFDKDYYTLEEEEFVRKMRELIDEKVALLEAKNFDDGFTAFEKERIAYSVAERVALYPLYRKQANYGAEYVPGKVFLDFLSSFSLDNEMLFGAKAYRSFVLNYVCWQGSRDVAGRNYSDAIIDYILSTVNNATIKNFLLTEIVFRHIWENNGLEGADYLLTVFRRECTDRNKVNHLNEMLRLWERIAPGQPAPDFRLTDTKGRTVTLDDFKGHYLYITVWATWCVPCKGELPYLDVLQEDYAGRNIRFLTVAIDVPEHRQAWLDFIRARSCEGVHVLADDAGKFNENYMIISVPRFILIAPDGKIVNSNAPRPSGQIRQVFDELDI